VRVGLLADLHYRPSILGAVLDALAEVARGRHPLGVEVGSVGRRHVHQAVLVRELHADPSGAADGGSHRETGEPHTSPYVGVVSVTSSLP
jgi:hypothetical protein